LGCFLTPGITIRSINTLKFNISDSYGENVDDLQYITSIPGLPNDSYILGKINQQTLNFTFRVDYSITPELSFQYYGSPFVSKGKFTDYKEVTNPNASGYSQRFIPYSGALDNPDFNFHQFRSNMVAQWEYRLGSFLFLVWSDDRTVSANPINSDMFGSMKQLFKISPGNFFLIKLNYWFSI